MRIDLTHLAVSRPLTRETGLKSALRGAFAPLDGMLEGFLRSMGTLKQVEYNYKGGVLGGTGTGPTAHPGVVSVNEITLDFAAIAAARVAAGQAALASADILNLFGVTNGIWVPAVAMEVTTEEGGTATAGLGDGTNAAGFISAGDLNSAAWYSSLITTTYSLATAGGKIYAAADTVDMTLNHNSIGVAVARVIAVMVDLRSTR